MCRISGWLAYPTADFIPCSRRRWTQGSSPFDNISPWKDIEIVEVKRIFDAISIAIAKKEVVEV